MHRPYGFMPQRNRPGGMPRGGMGVGSRMANPQRGGAMGGQQQRMAQQPGIPGQQVGSEYSPKQG